MTHWSTRLLARTAVGIGDARVARASAPLPCAAVTAGDVQVLRRPEFEAKVRAVVGLYLDSPRTRSSCAWTRRAGSSARRTEPILPLPAAVLQRATHDYKSNDITNLFAALEVATAGSPTSAMTGTARPNSSTSSNGSTAPSRTSGCVRADRQLPHPQARRYRSLARGKPPGDAAFHPDVRVVAGPRRGVLRHHHRQAIGPARSTVSPSASLPSGPSSTAGSALPPVRREQDGTETCPTPVNDIQTRDTSKGCSRRRQSDWLIRPRAKIRSDYTRNAISGGHVAGARTNAAYPPGPEPGSHRLLEHRLFRQSAWP